MSSNNGSSSSSSNDNNNSQKYVLSILTPSQVELQDPGWIHSKIISKFYHPPGAMQLELPILPSILNQEKLSLDDLLVSPPHMSCMARRQHLLPTPVAGCYQILTSTDRTFFIDKFVRNSFHKKDDFDFWSHIRSWQKSQGIQPAHRVLQTATVVRNQYLRIRKLLKGQSNKGAARNRNNANKEKIQRSKKSSTTPEAIEEQEEEESFNEAKEPNGTILTRYYMNIGEEGNDLKAAIHEWMLCNVPQWLQPQTGFDLSRFQEGQMDGINVPWLYLGPPESMFAIHGEDDNCVSINIMPCTEASDSYKRWYFIDVRDNDKFHDYLIQNKLIEGLGDDAKEAIRKLMASRMMFFDPKVLRDAGIRVWEAIQKPNHMIITLGAYHWGYNAASAALAWNIYPASWLNWALRDEDRFAQAVLVPLQNLVTSAVSRIQSDLRCQEELVALGTTFTKLLQRERTGLEQLHTNAQQASANYNIKQAPFSDAVQEWGISSLSGDLRCTCCFRALYWIRVYASYTSGRPSTVVHPSKMLQHQRYYCPTCFVSLIAQRHHRGVHIEATLQAFHSMSFLANYCDRLEQRVAAARALEPHQEQPRANEVQQQLLRAEEDNNTLRQQLSQAQQSHKQLQQRSETHKKELEQLGQQLQQREADITKVTQQLEQAQQQLEAQQQLRSITVSTELERSRQQLSKKEEEIVGLKQQLEQAQQVQEQLQTQQQLLQQRLKADLASLRQQLDDKEQIQRELARQLAPACAALQQFLRNTSATTPPSQHNLNVGNISSVNSTSSSNNINGSETDESDSSSTNNLGSTSSNLNSSQISNNPQRSKRRRLEVPTLDLIEKELVWNTDLNSSCQNALRHSYNVHAAYECNKTLICKHVGIPTQKARYTESFWNALAEQQFIERLGPPSSHTFRKLKHISKIVPEPSDSHNINSSNSNNNNNNDSNSINNSQ